MRSQPSGRFALSMAVTALLVVAACGGSAGPGSSQDGGPGATNAGGGGSGGGGGGGGGAPSDVCALLTVDEVAGALSTDPTLTAGPIPDVPQSCLYVLPGTAGGALEVIVVSGDADSYFAALTETRETVAGVADGAVYSTSIRELDIRTAGVVVRLRALYASDAETTLNNLKALAAIVVARMGGGSVPPGAQITAPPLVHVENACGLLGKEDVARVLGAGPIAVVDTAGQQFCSYTVESTGEYLVGIYLDRKGGMAAWQELLAEGTTVPVDGLGTDAAWEAFNKRLSVQVGDQIMHVELYAAPDDKALGLARELMQVMLGNI